MTVLPLKKVYVLETADHLVALITMVNQANQEGKDIISVTPFRIRCLLNGTVEVISDEAVVRAPIKTNEFFAALQKTLGVGISVEAPTYTRGG